MAETYLLRGARQLLTLRGPSEARRGSGLAELAIIPDGAVLIRNGKIEEVGMSRRVENLAASRSAQVIDATGRIVMPAFVDHGVSLVHAHSCVDSCDERLLSGRPQTPCGQRADIAEGIRALRLLAKKGLSLRARSLAESFARHGTASVGAVSGYGLDETGEIKTLRVLESLESTPLNIEPIFMGGNVVPEDISADAYARSILAPLVPVVARRRLAGIAAVRCGPCAFDVPSARPYLLVARECGLRRAVFSHQFASDDSVRFAVEIDAISAHHLEHLDDHGVNLLARSRTAAVLTPAATIHMGLTRFAPARQLIDRGAAVALSTGFNPGQCATHSMPYVISVACRHLRMSPAEAIVAATVNAAHAMGIGHKTGTIELGKQADLLILNARDYREIPQAPGLNLVHMLIKSGRILLE